jgi:hypothetical protein
MAERKLVLFLIVSFLGQSNALARGSLPAQDTGWNRDHIERLPSDVRYALLRMCRDRPIASRYFATYLNQSKIVRLHFEDLQCEGGYEFRVGRDCLREEFVAVGSHYRLARTYYDKCGG